MYIALCMWKAAVNKDEWLNHVKNKSHVDIYFLSKLVKHQKSKYIKPCSAVKI